MELASLEADALTSDVSLPSRAGEVLQGVPAERLSDVSAVLSRLLSDGPALLGWLRGFLETVRATEVAARSYWHFNGFAKLLLHDSAAFRIRLHVWPAGRDRLGESNPHGHRWNFSSRVLCGDGLATTEHTESPEGVSHRRYRYVSGSPGGELTFQCDAALLSAPAVLVRAGQTHSVDTSIVHTVRPVGVDVVATLLVQGVALTEATVVYCAPDRSVDEPVASITSDAVRDLVRAVIAAGEW